MDLGVQSNPNLHRTASGPFRVRIEARQRWWRRPQFSIRTCWKQIHSAKERSFTELRFASSLAQLWVTWGAVKGQDERPFGAPLTALHVTSGSPAAQIGRAHV